MISDAKNTFTDIPLQHLDEYFHIFATDLSFIRSLYGGSARILRGKVENYIKYMNWSELLTPFNLTLAVLVLSAIFFMSGKVRADLVALCTMIVLMLLGILEPKEALLGFSDKVVIMMMGLFVVGAGIFRTGLAKMISSKILKLGGDNESLLFVLILLVTGIVGAFVSNTGTVAVMMPIVISMAASSGINPKRYLMPMAFASSMGMFTLISTPPILFVQKELEKYGDQFEQMGFFTFAPIGAVALTVGVVVLFFLSRFLKTSKKEEALQESRGKSLSELVEEYKISTQIYKMVVPARSPLAGKTLEESKVATTYLVSIVKIVHKGTNGRIIKAPVVEVADSTSIIKSGDILYCRGSQENADRFAEEQELTVEKMTRREANEYFGDYGIAEVYIIPTSKLINHTVTESRFREKYNVNVLGVKQKGDYKISELRDVKLHEGDALLIQGPWEEIAAMAEKQTNFVVIGQPAKEAAKVTLDSKAPVAAFIMFMMIFSMVFGIVDDVAAVLTAAVLMVVTGCLRNMEEAYNSINWSSIVLIGSMIPMATAFDKTGVTAFIADWLLYGLGDISAHMLLAVIYLATSVMTMFMSNSATAMLFIPIAMRAAIGMNADPFPFLCAVAVSASMCFASPFSTPPNALVMSAGKYTFKDYIKVGLPLQIIMGIVMILVLPLMFPF